MSLIPREISSVARLCWRVADGGARLSLGGLRQSERLVLSLLKQRMEVLELPAAGATNGAGDPPAPTNALEDLLTRSLEQSGADGRDEVYARIVRDLVPDEARILASLAHADGAALVHVETISGRRLLTNATMLGRTAALAVPQLTTQYVEHLLRLGLVEVGPQLAELKLEYELLLADRPVREAMKTGVGPVSGRAVRRSLRLSELGRDLWEACGATSAA